MQHYNATLIHNDSEYRYFDIKAAANDMDISIDLMPFSIRVIFENLLRNSEKDSENNIEIFKYLSRKYSSIASTTSEEYDISFYPARVLMQDFTGVPAVVDIAAMRDATADFGCDPAEVNPNIPVDLVIDHSVQVDKYGTSVAFKENTDIEFARNNERYEFLKWAQQSLKKFRVVPPGTGICHQVNLEYLAKVVFVVANAEGNLCYPDTLVGTDSHTTMVNALGVLGWGVGGIEAEAAMLGEPISMLLPNVVGVHLTGRLRSGVTATDLVLTITHELRKLNVVGKFVEFYGDGLQHLSLADRATVSNMAPEYGATCGFFPIDAEVMKYLYLSGRSDESIATCEKYAKQQGLWYDHSESTNSKIKYDEKLEIKLDEIKLSVAGPYRPQDKVLLEDAAKNFATNLSALNKNPQNLGEKIQLQNGELKNGSIVISAITSCTNTSNPFAMIAAGLLAKKAVMYGLHVKPWVKTSFAPGSKVVTEYIQKAGLQEYLDALGFNLVGYGCTTCIGNSGPLNHDVENAIIENQLVTVSVLSGNRNFEGRVHPLVRANYLAAPMLCVAYALVGSFNVDITKDVIGKTTDGKKIFLNDIMPTSNEVNTLVNSVVTREMFVEKYASVFDGDNNWKSLQDTSSIQYAWNENSTYIKHPPYFDGFTKHSASTRSLLKNVHEARILAIFGDSITTDHISPAGSIAKNSPAAKYLIECGISHADFNSYGARRGNHEVMMRGTFANVRIRNKMVPKVEGGYTQYNDEIMSIYDASVLYKQAAKPLVIFAGKNYGTGSSRDWAAKGTFLLGVKCVIAESFERIHRSNLIGMGVIPLQLSQPVTSLELTGREVVEIGGLEDELIPKQKIVCKIINDHNTRLVDLMLCVDTEREIEYLQGGGIMQYVLAKKLR